MKTLEHDVASYYSDTDLLGRILSGLEASGIDLDKVCPGDLAPVEEFHIGGRPATAYAVDKMSLRPDQHVLDVGCGIGGTARHIAAQAGCKVSGIDLTPDYVASAQRLTELTNLDDQITFDVASALDMPFSDQLFDAAITIHVAMNIADRRALYREIARVLKPGATLCLFNVMKKSNEPLAFPVPWASSKETSYLSTVDEMHTFLEDAGLTIREIEDRTDFALDYFHKTMAAATSGPPPLGIHLVMGESAAVKLENVVSNLKNGRIAPVLMIATR